MKKIVIVLLVLVLACTSLSAVDLGHLGVSTKGNYSWATLTWKDGITDGVNINAGYGPAGLYLGGQWYVFEGDLAGIDWLGWHAGPGVHTGIGSSFMIGVELFAGLDWYPGILFDINLPLEFFIDYGVGLDVLIGGGSTVFNPNFLNYSAGIRWMFD